MEAEAAAKLKAKIDFITDFTNLELKVRLAAKLTRCERAQA